MDNCNGTEQAPAVGYKRKDRRVKFECFTERIKRIRIDIIPKQDLSTQVPCEKETFFFEGIIKWRELNETADFSSFLSPLRDKVQTLPLLLHHREFILEAIITAISEAEEISLEPILDLAVQLARDLQQDFSPYFPRLFSVLAVRLSSSDPGVIERVFSCLAHLFKILWRHLIAESEVVCRCYSQLLASQREYLLRFAAESLSFLLRRSLAASQQRTLQALFKVLTEETAEGVGTVLFEIMKGPQSHLHSCTHGLLAALLDQLTEATDPFLQLVALKKTTLCLVMHSSVESAQECINITMDILSESGSMSDVILSGVISLFSLWVGPDRCRLTADSFGRSVDTLVNVCREISERSGAWNACMDLFLRLVRGNQRGKLVDVCHLVARVSDLLECVITGAVWSVQGACELIEGVLPLLSEELFRRYVLTPWVCVSERVLQESADPERGQIITDRVLYCWSQVLSRVSGGQEEEEKGEKRIKLDSTDTFGANFLSALVSRAEKQLAPDESADLSALCLCLQAMAAPPAEALQLVEDSTRQLYAAVTFQGDSLVARPESLLSTLRDCLQTLASRRDLQTVLPPHQLITFLSLSSSYSLLEATEIYTAETSLSPDVTDQLIALMVPRLSSPYSHVRLKAVSILLALSPPAPLDRDLLSLCLSCEQTQADPLHFKQRLGCLRGLSYSTGGGRGQLETELSLRLLVSQFYVNFSPVWEQVRQLITSYAVEESKTLFWKIIGSELESEQGGETTPLDLSNKPASLDKWFLQRENLERIRCQEARVDTSNYQMQLWHTLLQVPSFCEARSRTLVPILTRYMERWYVPTHTGIEALQEIGVGDGTETRESRGGGKQRQIAVSMLELFSHFKHPQSLYQADSLRSLYMRLLTHPLSDLQTSALSCLVSLQLKHLARYHDDLRAVAAENNISSQLSAFSSEACEVLVMEEEHRPDIIPILCRILYGVMLRHGSSERSSPTQTAILQFLTSCDPSEVSLFLELALSPFRSIITGQTMDTPQGNEPSFLVVPLKKQISFLTLLKHLFFHLTTQIPDRHITDILTLLINTCKQCVSLLATATRDRLKRWTLPLIRSIRSLAITRLIDVSHMFPHDVIISREELLFSSLISPSLSRSPGELSQGGSLLELVLVWSSIPECTGFFEKPVAPEHPTLISYTLNTLSEKSVHKRASDHILDISLNLLQHSETLVSPHIGVLLRFIREELSAARRERRPAGGHARELEILSLAAPWVEEGDADVLVDNILHFLRGRGARSNQLTISILSSVKSLVSRVLYPEKVSNQLSPLFSQLIARGERHELVAAFEEIAARLPSVSSAVCIARELNAWREDEIEEIDYVRRNRGFQEARRGLEEGQFEEESLRIIAFNCIHFLFSQEEVNLRNLAVEFLQELIEWDSLDIYRPVICRCVIPAVKRGIRSQHLATRSECIGLLSCVTKRFFAREKFSELLPLVSSDREVDVFENLVHIQLHRRTAAVAKLSKLAASNTFSPHTLRQFLLPIVSHFLQCSQHEREHNLLSNAIEFIGRTAKQLTWTQYAHLLKLYLRAVTADKSRLDESVTIRIVVSILQNYHFDVSVEAKSSATGESEDENEEGPSEEVLNSAVAEGHTIQDVMSRQILPELEALMDSTPTSHTSGGHKLSHLTPTGCDIRAPVALAIVQLLLKLPRQMLDTHLPGILLKLVRALHTRDWEQRQEVRRVLREVASCLGAGHLSGMFAEMQQQLARGYQLHVLTYSIHTMLEGMKKKLRPGDLDASVSVLSGVIANDLFGRPSEEREVREIAVKTVEVRHPKGLEVLELLSTFVSPSAIHGVVDPFLEKLFSAESNSTVDLVRDGLKRVSQGLLRNRAMTSQKLLIFVYQQLTLSVGRDSSNNKASETAGCSPTDTKYLEEVRRDCYLLQRRAGRGGVRPRVKANSNSQLITEFCLSLLSSALKADKKINTRHQTVLEMLDPFIEILTALLPTPHLRISLLSVRILGQVSSLSLPSLATHTSQLKTHILAYLNKHGSQRDPDSPSNEMLSTCFRVLTSLLTQQRPLPLSRAELEPLLVSLEQAILLPSRQTPAFSLLRALIRRGSGSKLLWQLMQEIARLSVQEESQLVQREARSCLMLYLTETPITRKKMKQCLDFILSNLEYQLESGRQSAARLTTLVLQKFPREILNDLAEYFYLPIALALANEESRNTKRLYELSLKSLFSKVDTSRMDNIYGMGWEWICGDNTQLIYMGVSSLLVLLETGVGPANKKLDAILKQLISILTRYKDSHKLILVCMECLLKMLKKNGIAVVCREDRCGALECCVPLINSESMEIRVVAAKLFGNIFSQTKQSNLSTKDVSYKILFRDSTQLVSAAQAFVDLINSKSLCGEETAQVVKNLIFLFTRILTEGSLSTLKYLLRQMVKKATLEAVLSPKHVVKRRCTYQLLAAMAVTMDNEALSSNITKFVKPLFYEVSHKDPRARRGGMTSQKQEEIKALAQEGLDLIKKKVGTELYNQELLSLQRRAGEVRVHRKTHRSQLATTDPVKYANMKIRKHTRQSLARKRKISIKSISRKFNKTREAN